MSVGVISILLILSMNALAQTEVWEWGNPIPQGNELYDVTVVSDSFIVAVGELGSIIKTTDAGETWNVQQFATLTNAALLAVDFPDAQHGWCVGKNGVILATQDGGVTWERQSSAVFYHLYDVKFVDAQKGWIVGRFGKILRTIDGGKTWQEQESGSLRALRAIQFVSPERGFIVGSGGTILKTINGGEQWLPLEASLDANLKSVSFINDSLGMVAGEKGTIFKTTDGGGTWSPLNSGADADIYKVFMLTDSSAWILGYKTINDFQGEYRDNPVALMTIDGGQSWTPLSEEPIPFLNGISQGTGEAVWCVGSGGAMLTATPAGEELTARTVTPILNAFQIDFLDSEHGWLAGAKWVARTVDGGETWQTAEIDSAYFLYAVEFISADTGWAAGGAYILDGGAPVVVADLYKSCDGGQTWEKRPLENSQRILDIQFVNSKVGFLVGEGGSLFKTIDGGESWQKLNARTANFLFDVHFFNDSTGLYCGGSGKIARTVDGGETWSNIRTRTPEWLLDLYFIDDSIGFASGSGGTILKTLNGGESWEAKETTTFSDLYSIYFLTPRVGWAVGTNGIIIKTTDYGETWSQLPLITTDDLTSIVVNENGAGFIVGMTGTLLRTREGLTEVEKITHRRTPSLFKLHQNYPNPFNASTVIVFELARDSEIQLNLYDVRGRLLKRLFAGSKAAGVHSISLNTETLPSAAYLYQLQAEDEIETRMMILQK